MEMQNDGLEKEKKIITPENFAEVADFYEIKDCVFKGDFLRIDSLFKFKKFINCENIFDNFFFEECYFENCKFQYCNFKNCTFIKKNKFENCKFENCTFAKENKFEGCKIKKCNFQNAEILQNVIDCEIYECDFLKIIFNKKNFQKILHDQKIKINNTTLKEKIKNPERLYFCIDFENHLQQKIDGSENKHVFMPIIFELSNGQQLKVLAQTYFIDNKNESKKLALIFLENYLFKNEKTGEEQKIWENVIYTPGKNFLPIAEKEIIDPSTKYFKSGKFDPKEFLSTKKISVPNDENIFFSVRINRPVQEIEIEEIIEKFC